MNALNIGIITRDDLYPADHGAAVKITQTCRALSQNGHRVIIVGNSDDKFTLFENGRPGSIEYPSRAKFIKKLPDAFIKPLLSQIGIPAEDHFLFRAMLEPALFTRAFWVARKFGFDVVQAEFPAYGFPALLVARILKKPFVLVEHNIEYQRISESVELKKSAHRNLAAVEKLILRLADHIVCCSNEERKKLLKLSVGPAKINVIPHGVANSDFQHSDRIKARDALGIGEDSFVLVFHGYLSYPPNSEAIAVIRREILPRLEGKIKNLKIIVAGRNPPDDAPAAGPLEFPGPADDVPALLAAADVAIVPLLSGGGTRLKILEYFAAALPVVSTTKGAEGLPVKDGENILIADDWDDFAEKIISLYSQKSLRKKIGQSGRAVAAEHDWSAIAERYEKLYRAIL